MIAVFVETNWVVEVCGPKYFRNEKASSLLDRAARGELQLHLPAICLLEARRKITDRSRDLASLRAFQRFVDAEDPHRDQTLKIIDEFLLASANQDLSVEHRLEQLRAAPGVDVFPLNEEALALSLDLATKDLFLQPFDFSILAAVISHAETVFTEADDVLFCSTDGDLRPWTKSKVPKRTLWETYKKRGIRFVDGFDVAPTA